MELTVIQQVAALQKASLPVLRDRWRILMGTEPPKAYNRTQLVRRLVWRLQEIHYGGLCQAARDQLHQIADADDLAGGKPRRPKQRKSVVAPGTRLVRATDGTSEGILSDELRSLNDEYANLEKRLRELDADSEQASGTPTERDVAEALRMIDPLWEQLFPAEKERIVRLLVESAVVRPDGLTVRLRPMGLLDLATELAPDQTNEQLLEAIA